MHLEPITPEHADAVQRLARDPLVTATTTLPEPYPDGGAAWWIADLLPRRAAGQEHVFAMRVEDGEIAGVVGLADVDRPGGSAELGYWVGVPYWGRGYATAACVLAVDFAFGSLGLAEVHAYPLRENGASRRVLEKAGFFLEGIVPNKYPKWGPDRSLAHYVIRRAHWS
jgi:RimJ/RimL family protein N-acetyltransferase